ncbi:MAG: signal protein [Gammaproteobacteria bacterium]|nr:signal protein [Gammaproteobacteria bacterium]
MSLLVRINVALGGVFIIAAFATGYVFWGILESNARREVLADAGLMMDSALATRAYTASEILPLLSGRMSDEFPPQSVPFYAATQNFLQLRKRHAEYSYKEATLNPTNPRDRAADWEADIIQRFRNDPHADEVIGERETPMGTALFLARPIRTEASCSPCHSLPSVAPRALIARYGSDNGFGWQNNEVVGAQVVSVPFAHATASAQRAFHAFMLSLIVVFAAVFAVVNAVLYFLLVRPVRRIAGIAERISLGDMSAPEFPQRGAAEMDSLARSFNRMRKSLEKALRLIES